jgi:hypothetical protein
MQSSINPSELGEVDTDFRDFEFRKETVRRSTGDIEKDCRRYWTDLPEEEKSLDEQIAKLQEMENPVSAVRQDEPTSSELTHQARKSSSREEDSETPNSLSNFSDHNPKLGDANGSRCLTSGPGIFTPAFKGGPTASSRSDIGFVELSSSAWSFEEEEQHLGYPLGRPSREELQFPHNSSLSVEELARLMWEAEFGMSFV